MAEAPDAILFDLDGTLVDSAPGILASCRSALRSLGHAADELEVGGLIGPPLEEVMATLLARLGDERVDEAVAAYRTHYGAEGLLATTDYPGIAAALDGLAARGVALYVATSKRRVFAERILANLGLADRFAAIHGSEPGGAVDHKVELIADLVARRGLRAERCLMVGDRRQDVAGAHANGVGSVGVLWGYGSREELADAGAQRILARPEDLVGLAAAG